MNESFQDLKDYKDNELNQTAQRIKLKTEVYLKQQLNLITKDLKYNEIAFYDILGLITITIKLKKRSLIVRSNDHYATDYITKTNISFKETKLIKNLKTLLVQYEQIAGNLFGCNFKIGE